MTKRSTEMMYTVRMHITNPAQNLEEKKKKRPIKEQNMSFSLHQGFQSSDSGAT